MGLFLGVLLHGAENHHLRAVKRTAFSRH